MVTNSSTQTLRFYGQITMQSEDLSPLRMKSSLRTRLKVIEEDLNTKPPYKIEIKEGDTPQSVLNNEMEKTPLTEGEPVDIVFEGDTPLAHKLLIIENDLPLQTVLFARICMYVGQPTLVELAEVLVPEPENPTENYIKTTYRPLKTIKQVTKAEFEKLLVKNQQGPPVRQRS